jgi:uncharacterized protein (TIGR02266 family)
VKTAILHPTVEPGASGRSGTHRRSDAAEQLQRKLEQALGEIAELRAERDQLQSRLSAALDELALMKCPAPSLIPTITPSAAPTPSLIPSTPPTPSIIPARVASWAPASEQTLSRVIVSTYPPEELPSSSAERRRLERLGCEFEVEFLDDTHLITGFTQDISEGGVFVATYETLPLGTSVSLALELPGGRIEVRGQVRWARPELEAAEQRPGLGIAFTELPPEALAALTEFCRSRPAHYYEV